MLSAKEITLHMTEEDRQKINKLMEHKRILFVDKIKRGVIAMLNSQAERKILYSERQDFLRSLSSQNKRKKQQLTSVTNVMKDATGNAPMGIGSASTAILTTANSVGTALLDSVEEKRKDDEAEKRFISAQFMHYIPSDDYEGIATKVANILGYRFQFLIFRLAGGEEGYIKLANFFIESMNAYAIECLRERKGEYVKALIDAAIPPISNVRRYREWFDLDPANFKINVSFGTLKKLQLDQVASDIVSRCGPAVRALLGGYETWIDPITSIEKKFKPYTIKGALHHAFILNTHGEVMSCLGTKGRHYEPLRGDNKYPAILLSCNESTIGVNVATNITSVVLPNGPVTAMKRLNPPFFQNHAVYDSVEKSTYETNNTFGYYDLKYPEEQRAEIPWGRQKDELWKNRLKELYNGARNISTVDDIPTISNSSKLKVMLDIGNSFDKTHATDEAMKGLHEASLKYISAFENLDIPKRENILLNSAIAAKYLAILTKNYLISLTKFDLIKPEEINLALQFIGFARITLSSLFDLPLIEINKRQNLNRCSIRIEAEAKHVHELKFITYKNTQILLEYLEHAPKAKSFSSRAFVAFFEHTKKQFKENVQELEKSVKLGKVITKRTSNVATTAVVEFEPKLNAFQEKALIAHALISKYQDKDGFQDLVLKIEANLIEAKAIFIEIDKTLSNDDYFIEILPFSIPEEEAQELELESKKNLAKKTAKQKVQMIETDLLQAKNLIRQRSLRQKYINDDDLLESLKIILLEVNGFRQTCEDILLQIKIKPKNDEEETPLDNLLFKRLKAHHVFGLISMLAPKFQNAQIKETLTSLEEHLNQMYQSNIEQALNSVENIFREISSEQLDSSDINTLRRHKQKTEKLSKEKEKLDQSIDCDIDTPNCVFNRDQRIISGIHQIKQDEHDLSEKILNLLDNKSSVITEIDTNISLKDKALDPINYLIKLYSPVSSVAITASANEDSGTFNNEVAFRDKSSDSLEEDTSPVEIAEEYEIIYQTINKIIHNVISKDIPDLISENDIKQQICVYLNILKDRFVNENNFPDDWGSWLIASVIYWITQKILKHEVHGIEASHGRSMQELASMKEILNEEPISLKNAKRAALEEIRATYIQLKQTLKLQSKQTEVRISTISEEAIISNELTWVARPTYAELKWLDERSVKYKARVISTENKRSPIILLTFILIAYFTNKIEEKRTELAQLNRLLSLQMQCARLYFKIKESTLYKESYKENKKLYNLESHKSSIDLMERIITQKHEKVEEEKTDVQANRENILSQRLKIYFNEWRKKTHSQETISELAKATRQVKLEQTNSLSDTIKVSVNPGFTEHEEKKEAETQRVKKKGLRVFENQAKINLESYTNQDIEDILTSTLSDLNNLQFRLSQIFKPNSSRMTLYPSSTSERSSDGSLGSGSPSAKKTTPPLSDGKIYSTDRITLNR